MVTGYFAPSVKKAFEVLKAVSQSKGGIGISELARDLEMAKSTVHGMTQALEELGAVRRDPISKKYTLGVTLFELGKSAYSQINLKDVARPVMEELMERTQDSVFIGVLNWEHVTIIDIVESRRDLKITSPIGTSIPLLAGAVGKVLLADMKESEAVKLIRKKGIISYTRNTITDVDAYLQEIRAVREQSYAIDDEEYILGVQAVAAPIRGADHFIAAIWVVGFKAGLDENRMKILIKETTAAAEKINKRISQAREPVGSSST